MDEVRLDIFALTVSWIAVFGGIGMLIGNFKGRAIAGLLLGTVIGPIGWLLIWLGPDKRRRAWEPKKPRNW
jgi:hypothetical protein